MKVTNAEKKLSDMKKKKKRGPTLGFDSAMGQASEIQMLNSQLLAVAAELPMVRILRGKISD